MAPPSKHFVDSGSQIHAQVVLTDSEHGSSHKSRYATVGGSVGQKLSGSERPSSSSRLSTKNIMSILNSRNRGSEPGTSGKSSPTQSVESERQTWNDGRSSVRGTASQILTPNVRAEPSFGKSQHFTSEALKKMEATNREIEAQRKKPSRRNSIGAMLSTHFIKRSESDRTKTPPPINSKSFGRNSTFHESSRSSRVSPDGALFERLTTFHTGMSEDFSPPHVPVSVRELPRNRSRSGQVEGGEKSEFLFPSLAASQDLGSGFLQEKPQQNGSGSIHSSDGSEGEDLRSQVSDLQNMSFLKDEEISKLTAMLTVSEKAAREQARSVKWLNEANAKLQEENESLSEQVRDLKASLSKAVSETRARKTAVEALERECKSVKKSLSSVCLERNILKSSLEKATASQEASMKECTSLHEQIGSKEAGELKTDCGPMASLQAQCSCLLLPELSQESFIGQLKDDNEVAIKALREELLLARRRVSELEEEVRLCDSWRGEVMSMKEDKGSELEKRFIILRKLFEHERAKAKLLKERFEDAQLSHFSEIAQHKQHLGHLQTSLLKMDTCVQQQLKEVDAIVPLVSSISDESLVSKVKELRLLIQKGSSIAFGHQNKSIRLEGVAGSTYDSE